MVKTFAPVTAAYLLSFLLYGFWPKYMVGMNANPNAANLFPWLVPLGLYVFFASIRTRDSKLSMIPTPMIAPYASQANWSGSMLGMLNRRNLFIFTWIMLWVYTIVRFVLAYHYGVQV